jgi:ubiquinone/menaquinone biosynthesis C-methylase UbiE
MEKEIKLNLGSGLRPLYEYVNIDKSDKAKCDLILDLEEGNLPYNDNSVCVIEATHVLEHIKNIIPLMNECYRVLKRGGRMYITVPQNEGMWADPTHVRAFSRLSFRYFCGYAFNEVYEIKCRFKQIKCEFIPNDDGGILNVILEK